MHFLALQNEGVGESFSIKKFTLQDILFKNGHFHHDFWAKYMKNGGGSNPKIFCAFLLNSVLGGNKLAKIRRWEASGQNSLCPINQLSLPLRKFHKLFL